MSKKEFIEHAVELDDNALEAATGGNSDTHNTNTQAICTNCGGTYISGAPDKTKYFIGHGRYSAKMPGIRRCGQCGRPCYSE